MKETPSQERIVRTIRLPDSRIDTILDGLDTVDNDEDVQNKKSERFTYRHRSIVVGLIEPGSGTAKLFFVQTRCMNAYELYFLHGGYVHRSVSCSVQLRSLHDTTSVVRGNVDECTYVCNNLHEVTIRFVDPIDISYYCANASLCRILVADDDPQVQRLVAHYLSKLNTEVEFAKDGKECIDKATHCVYDLILMDINMPNIDGIQALKTLRERDYIGPIAAFTGSSSNDDITALLANGFDQYVPKPFTQDILAKVLDTVRDEPLMSSFHEDDSMRDLINGFVADLSEIIQEIETASSRKDNDAILAHAEQLKETGTSFGFEEISQAASDIERCAREGDQYIPIGRLVQLLKRVRGID